MEKFPQDIIVSNKDRFPEMRVHFALCQLRADIHEHLLRRKNEEDYFSLDTWAKKHFDGRVRALHRRILSDIIPELEALGWKAKTSFGNTGLFIYSTEDPPVNCFVDGF